MKKKYLILNWKSYVNLDEAVTLFKSIKAMQSSNTQIVVCPPFPLIGEAVKHFEGTSIQVGSQDISLYGKGAYTGEVSGELLKSLGVTYVIIGHSERRELQKEKNADVLKKIVAAQEAGLTAILCIGEDAKQFKANKTKAALNKQIAECIADNQVNENLIIAYEPVWAIGTGLAATPLIVSESAEYIKELIDEFFPYADIPILYGGSVKSSNAESILLVDNIDGGLVGSAAIIPDEITAILKALEK